jgi:formate hydrogenlyase transcriptional activator
MSTTSTAQVALRAEDQASFSDRDRLALLLQIARASASLDLPQLIERVGRCLHETRWQWDHTSLCLFDPGENALRVHSFFFGPGPLTATHVRGPPGGLVPIDGTQSGRAFITGQACVVDTRRDYEAILSPAWAATIMPSLPPEYSSCIVPLICRGRRLGTLASSSARSHAFNSEAVRLLTELADTLAPAVDNALAYRQIAALKDRLAKEKSYLENEVAAGFEQIIGESPALQHVLSLVESVARTDSNVLITGETGTGKELIARAIHRRSGRGSHTFVKLHCAAIPSGLLESELFGYDRGAYTGAVSHKAGRFELANEGTLFLDEVGEIALETQPKLLRVLQDQEFERLGSTRTLRVDARVVAATNRDLATMVDQRLFRSDLFYRLNVFPIHVPPLRERREDIPLLARHFVDLVGARLRKNVREIPATTMDALCRYDWPGNIRELANVIERAVILSPAGKLCISPDSLADSGRGGGLVRSSAPRRLVDMESDFIRKTLEQTNWVIGGRAGAAQRLGLNRTTLQARMRKLGITRPGTTSAAVKSRAQDGQTDIPERDHIRSR